MSAITAALSRIDRAIRDGSFFDNPVLCRAVDRLLDRGIWYGLGDGETFEDMIFNTITEHGDIPCPECHEPVNVCEESLSDLAREMLSQL